MNPIQSPFSVCMSVYAKDEPLHFRTAVHSIYTHQTIKPNEIVLVVDGPINSQLQKIIEELQLDIDVLKVIYLPENRGHAISRQTGLEAASNELIAIMDSDDISLPNRFELQLKAFAAYSDVSVVGGIIHEFIGSIDNTVGIRFCPEKDADIKQYLKSRSPMNLVTVMFKKSDVLKVGGYIDWYCEEDYYLWVRLTLGGYKFYNICENLVNVRVGDEMYKRRGGIKYFKSEYTLQKYMYDIDIISFPRYIYNVLLRLIVQVILPNNLRGWLFQKFARVKKV